MQETSVPSLGQEGPLEKGIATHSSILAWRILWTEESGGLESVGWQRVGYGWAANTFKIMEMNVQHPGRRLSSLSNVPRQGHVQLAGKEFWKTPNEGKSNRRGRGGGGRPAGEGELWWEWGVGPGWGIRLFSMGPGGVARWRDCCWMWFPPPCLTLFRLLPPPPTPPKPKLASFSTAPGSLGFSVVS